MAGVREQIARDHAARTGLTCDAISVTPSTTKTIKLTECVDAAELLGRFRLLVDSVISVYGLRRNPEGCQTATGGICRRISQSTSQVYEVWAGPKCYQLTNAIVERLMLFSRHEGVTLECVRFEVDQILCDLPRLTSGVGLSGGGRHSLGSALQKILGGLDESLLQAGQWSGRHQCQVEERRVEMWRQPLARGSFPVCRRRWPL